MTRKALQDSWNRPINERLIISLYDYTGAWAQPYIDAGYPVRLWDYKVEGDILEGDNFERLTTEYKDYIYAFLSATPCTDFAVSGARWWEEKDKDTERIDTSIALAEAVLIGSQACPDIKFWALENPVGRLEKLIPEFKQYRKLMFDPCDYGDPYTKKTVLWGTFNPNLPKNPVLPLYGSLMHSIPPSEKRQEIRSATPAGFAKAFFLANP